MKYGRLTLAVLIAGPVALSAQCTAMGHDRWTVKTSAPSSATKAKVIALQDLATLAAPATVTSKAKGVKLLETRYTGAVGPGLSEGQLVRVTGWVRFIKLSSDDCDYHIQLTPDTANTDDMVVVEIPEADAEHVTDAALRAELAKARDTIPIDLHLKKAPGPSGNKIGKAYMTFAGALFFDAPHYPNCGKRGVGMQAATCWEVHPVTAVAFAPRP